VIFVHGCFWHRHANCRYAYTPKTRPKFWLDKFEKNRARDKRTLRELKSLGWKPLIVWECELKLKPDSVLKKVVRFLGGTGKQLPTVNRLKRAPRRGREAPRGQR
jgi:DNA mismatch endonuclease (patch repair protein)